MTTLTLDIEAQTLDGSQVREILRGGMVLRTCGWLNLKWSDVSAQSAAETLNLSEVSWAGTSDDTPSHLSLLVFYPHHSIPEIESRLHTIVCVMGYLLA